MVPPSMSLDKVNTSINLKIIVVTSKQQMEKVTQLLVKEVSNSICLLPE